MELWQLLARESIRDTIAAYNNAGDHGDLAGLAACFTEDGTMILDRGEPFVGRDGIVVGLNQVLPAAGADRPRPTHVHHHVASTYVRSLTPEEAEVHSYYVVLTQIGVDHWGRYRDAFVPVGDRWLLRSRRVSADGFAPDSLFARE